MPRHAATTTGPMLYPAYYLTAETRDYPLALLLDLSSEQDDLPTACGTRLLTTTDQHCSECGAVAVFEVEYGPSETATPFCAACTVGGDHQGLLPMCYVDLIPYE